MSGNAERFLLCLCRRSVNGRRGCRSDVDTETTQSAPKTIPDPAGHPGSVEIFTIFCRNAVRTASVRTKLLNALLHYHSFKTVNNNQHYICSGEFWETRTFEQPHLTGPAPTAEPSESQGHRWWRINIQNSLWKFSCSVRLFLLQQHSRSTRLSWAWMTSSAEMSVVDNISTVSDWKQCVSTNSSRITGRSFILSD